MAELSELHVHSRLAPAPLRAHAVTEAARAALPDGDEEELEYAALTAAALESCRLATLDADWQRVVVAADVDASVVRPRGTEPTSVEVTVEIALRQCASVHVDDSSAKPDVTAARSTLAADGQPSTDVLELLDDHELLWFATQEIADLLN
jgi:hypothetical protein